MFAFNFLNNGAALFLEYLTVNESSEFPNKMFWDTAVYPFKSEHVSCDVIAGIQIIFRKTIKYKLVAVHNVHNYLHIITHTL